MDVKKEDAIAVLKFVKNLNKLLGLMSLGIYLKLKTLLFLC